LTEGESGSRNSNLMSVFKIFFGSIFFTKNFFFIRVDRRVIGVEELESDVNFLKFFSDRFFYTKDRFFYKKFFFYKG
jgi:hypothetical protein